MVRILSTIILGPFRQALSIGFVSEKGLWLHIPLLQSRETLKRKKASEAYESKDSKKNKATNKIRIELNTKKIK